MSAISIRNITKSFSDVKALDGISLTIADGDFFGLLGPNGAGKTTLMRVLCGLLAPDDGEVEMLGRRTSRWNVPPELGVVPQDIALYDMLSAEANLRLFGSLRGMDGSTLTKRIDAVLELVGLKDRRDSRVKGFSGGMKRRLNLAAGLLHEPKILLLDEPTVGVDPQSRVSIFNLLEDLHRHGVTIIYTTHYMEEAERLCRTIAVIDRGKVLAAGTLHDLLSKVETPRFVRMLLRSDDEKPPKFAGAKVERQGTRVDLHPRTPKGLPALLAKASDFEGAQRVEVIAPTLETLFLELTGKELRDA
jgi:ABC-2 type transport system ATP-binding protein